MQHETNEAVAEQAVFNEQATVDPRELVSYKRTPKTFNNLSSSSKLRNRLRLDAHNL